METNDAGMDYGASVTLSDLEKNVGFKVCPLTRVIVPQGRRLAYYADSELHPGVIDCQLGGTLEVGVKMTTVKPCSLDYARKCPLYQGRNNI